MAINFSYKPAEETIVPQVEFAHLGALLCIDCDNQRGALDRLVCGYQGTKEKRISICCKLADGKINQCLKIGSRWAGTDSEPQSYQYGKMFYLLKVQSTHRMISTPFLSSAEPQEHPDMHLSHTQYELRATELTKHSEYL